MYKAKGKKSLKIFFKNKKVNKRTPFNKHVATGKKAQKLISVPLPLFRSLE